MREIIFDTETTGLKASEGERVIEIGGVELVNRFASGRTFHHYINPEGRPIHPDAQRVHGISVDDLRDKPTFAKIADEFLEFFLGAKLIAHNAPFDMGFINAELARIGRSAIPPADVVDTLEIARRRHPMGPNSLDALCARYGIDNSHRTKHGALLDAELLAEVYIEMLGGRQASLDLPASSANASDDGSPNVISSGRQGTRPRTLPPRLSEADLERHRAFVEESLGPDSIWSKTGG